MKKLIIFGITMLIISTFTLLLGYQGGKIAGESNRIACESRRGIATDVAWGDASGNMTRHWKGSWTNWGECSREADWSIQSNEPPYITKR